MNPNGIFVWVSVLTKQRLPKTNKKSSQQNLILKSSFSTDVT